jgi:hypothetical protein
MRKARILAVAGAALAAALLAGCEKETGPETADITAAAPSVATPVPPVVADPAATRPLFSFEGMDANGDGVVESAENAKASQAIFQAIDLDKDGAVTLAEMDVARAVIGERPQLSSEKLIEGGDSDHDGKLTLGEWVASANARFAAFDTNKDDALTLAEWQAGIAAEAPPPAAVEQPRAPKP